MKKSIVYVLLGIVCTVFSMAGQPFNGCVNDICTDFQTYHSLTIPIGIIGFVFLVLALRLMIQNYKFSDTNSYGSKDLSDFDG